MVNQIYFHPKILVIIFFDFVRLVKTEQAMKTLQTFSNSLNFCHHFLPPEANIFFAAFVYTLLLELTIISTVSLIQCTNNRLDWYIVTMYQVSIINQWCQIIVNLRHSYCLFDPVAKVTGPKIFSILTIFESVESTQFHYWNMKNLWPQFNESIFEIRFFWFFQTQPKIMMDFYYYFFFLFGTRVRKSQIQKQHDHTDFWNCSKGLFTV